MKEKAKEMLIGKCDEVQPSRVICVFLLPRTVVVNKRQSWLTIIPIFLALLEYAQAEALYLRKYDYQKYAEEFVVMRCV